MRSGVGFGENAHRGGGLKIAAGENVSLRVTGRFASLLLAFQMGNCNLTLRFGGLWERHRTYVRRIVLVHIY